jgi:hypothetical protein
MPPWSAALTKKFVSPAALSREVAKEKIGRTSRATYSGACVGDGLGFSKPRRDRTASRGAVRGQGFCPRRKMTARWATPVSVWRRGAGHWFG